MKKFWKALAAIALFLVGTFAAFCMLDGALEIWLHVEPMNAVLWSTIPSLAFGLWAANTTKEQ